MGNDNDPTDQIAETAAGPAEARDAAGSFKAQELDKLTAADRYPQVPIAVGNSGAALGSRMGQLGRMKGGELYSVAVLLDEIHIRVVGSRESAPNSVYR